MDSLMSWSSSSEDNSRNGPSESDTENDVTTERLRDAEQTKSSSTNDSNIQIHASLAEMKRRIAAFTASKRNEVSENNIREFCSDLPSAQKDGEERSTCARVDSAYVSRVGSTSHVCVTRVFNPQGPQTRGGYRDDCGPHAAGRSSPTSYTMSVEERLRNAEEHLNISSDRKADLFSRLKAVEEGMLFLSGLSPEYFPAGRMPQPKRRKVSRPEPVPEELSPTKLKTEYDSISEIDQRIFYLRDKLKKMKNQSS